MQVYRICLARWAGRLAASGRSARWNSKESNVISTAASRALACLENVVHRSGEGANTAFRVLVLEVPDDVPVDVFDENALPPDWADFRNHPGTQAFGDAWRRAGTTAVLKIPSALVAHEFNFLLNPAHPDFARIRLVATEPFAFGTGIKGG